MLARYALALVFVLAFAAGASAGHCTGPTSSPYLVFAGGYYVVNDLCQPECIYSIWVIKETNGMEGLQRATEIRDDTCHGMIEADGDPPIF